MKGTVERALDVWDLKGATAVFVAARENTVYRIDTGELRLALRLHRIGYRTDAELQSELAWMAAVARAEIPVPAPIATTDGRLLHHIDGIQVDILTWLDGETLLDVMESSQGEDHAARFFALGEALALLHEVSDAWRPPAGFSRAHWNRPGLVGDAPLWDRFWENPALHAEDRGLFERFRSVAAKALARLENDLDYGLIHADAVASNVLVDRDRIKLIDFDDGGYGFRLFDVATALLKHGNLAGYDTMQTSLLHGYRSIRPLETEALDLFLALRAATYVGWNISRMSEPGGVERNGRFIDALRPLARRVLEASD